MKRAARLTVRLAIDVESDIEDDELLEIHAAEVVRNALSHQIVSSSKKSTRIVGIFEGVDAHLETWVLKE